MIIQRILDEFDTRRGLLEQITQIPMAFFQHACRNNAVDLLKACIRGMMPGKRRDVLGCNTPMRPITSRIGQGIPGKKV